MKSFINVKFALKIFHGVSDCFMCNLLNPFAIIEASMCLVPIKQKQYRYIIIIIFNKKLLAFIWMSGHVQTKSIHNCKKGWCAWMCFASKLTWNIYDTCIFPYFLIGDFIIDCIQIIDIPLFPLFKYYKGCVKAIKAYLHVMTIIPIHALFYQFNIYCCYNYI